MILACYWSDGTCFLCRNDVIVDVRREKPGDPIGLKTSQAMSNNDSCPTEVRFRSTSTTDSETTSIVEIKEALTGTSSDAETLSTSTETTETSSTSTGALSAEFSTKTTTEEEEVHSSSADVSLSSSENPTETQSSSSSSSSENPITSITTSISSSVQPTSSSSSTLVLTSSETSTEGTSSESMSARAKTTSFTKETTKTTKPPSTTTEKQCPERWKMFQRKDVIWCLALVFGTSLTYNKGIEACKGYDAYLSGLDTDGERQFIMERAINVSKSLGYTNSNGVWINGKRRQACASANWTSIPECEKLGSFEFTDPFLYYFDGYEWDTDQPNGELQSGSIQDCLQLMIPKDTKSEQMGKVDDTRCSLSTDGTFTRRMVACGKTLT
ncbi:unnamed protein product [Caenorhabditis sp. 36 PRJEB53466]|nr:unnamed protein product [Caenorhabditis sp. 36 PRJEB53466]